jgi:hypothetical protein
VAAAGGADLDFLLHFRSRGVERAGGR